MGRRKKDGLPPIKLVIGRSPDKKKGKQNGNYTVLNQSVSDNDAAMRAKRKASNIDPKKWKEQDTDDDDDLEILQVYKPPPVKGPKIKAIPQQRLNRAPSLILECIDDELTHVQKQAFRRAQTEFDKAKQKIERIKSSNQCTEEILTSYIGPESTSVKHVMTTPSPVSAPVPVPIMVNNQRAPSPDLVIVDGPTSAKKKASKPIPVKQPVPAAEVLPGITLPPPPLQISPNAVPRMPTVSRPHDMVLMGPNGQPIVIPGHLMPQGNQPIVLQANQTGQLQIVGSGGQTAPVIGRPLIAHSNSKMAPPLAPRMSAMPNPNLHAPSPTPPLQNMATKDRGGTKRPQGTVVQQPPHKRTRNRRKQQQPLPLAPSTTSEDQDSVNWVPLDEYYYSKKEGDPAYREEKGEYRFKCFYCFKMLYNNLRIMMHIQGHIDSEKQQNLDLSDLTQCKHCYKQFDTPFEMQCHVEKIHQNRSNVLVCRICEKDHTSQGDLKGHMRMHNACEMPYICQLCNFRSSVYNDVVDHFKKRHDSSRYMVCLYCLKVFEIKFAKNSGWGMTQTYYQHLLKHQSKATKMKCSWCKLVFNNKQELQMHKSKDHMPNYRGTQASSSSRTVNASSEQVMIRVPDSSKSKAVKSLNAPISQRLLLIGFCDYFGLKPSHMCVECKQPMLMVDHYKKYTECSMCRFATTCNEAFAVHMNHFHVRGKQSRRLGYKERPLPKPRFCLCGYSSDCGNKIANHLISCCKRTCYSEKPEAKWFEYDDEQEEFNPFEPYCEEDALDEQEVSPSKDIPSLFGALGLVKKPASRSYSSLTSSKGRSHMERLAREMDVAVVALKKTAVNCHTQYCSAIHCTNSRVKNPGLSFYYFPKYGKKESEKEKTLERCQKWWINTRRKDLNFKKDYKKIIQLALCEKHFTADQFMNPAEKDCIKPRKHLRKDAVPSLFDIPNPTKPATERCRVLQKRTSDNTSLANVNWKRPWKSSPLREASPAQIAEEIIDDMLDVIFPAEASSGEFINILLNNVMRQINVIEKKKFRSQVAIEKSRRRSSDNTSVHTESTSDQKWDDLQTQSVQTASPAKSSVFTEEDQAGDHDMSVAGGSDVTMDENSLDSELKDTSTIATEDHQGEQDSNQDTNEHSSNMDWTTHSDADDESDEDQDKQPEYDIASSAGPTVIMHDEDVEMADNKPMQDNDDAIQVFMDDAKVLVADEALSKNSNSISQEAPDDLEGENGRIAKTMQAEVVDDNIEPSLSTGIAQDQVIENEVETNEPTIETIEEETADKEKESVEDGVKNVSDDNLSSEKADDSEEKVGSPSHVEETMSTTAEPKAEDTSVMVDAKNASSEPSSAEIAPKKNIHSADDESEEQHKPQKPEEIDIPPPEEQTKPPEEADIPKQMEKATNPDIVTKELPKIPRVDSTPTEEKHVKPDISSITVVGSGTQKSDANPTPSHVSKDVKQSTGRQSGQSRNDNPQNRDNYGNRDRHDDYRHSDHRSHDRSHGNDRNRDYDRHRDGYQDRNYHGSRDFNKSYERDRYGQGHYEDRHGYKGQHGNRDGSYYQGDRRDYRGGYRGGGNRGGNRGSGSGYYGNRGGYY